MRVHSGVQGANAAKLFLMTKAALRLSLVSAAWTEKLLSEEIDRGGREVGGANVDTHDEDLLFVFGMNAFSIFGPAS